MILLLAEKYRRTTAFLLFMVADLSFAQLAFARERNIIAVPPGVPHTTAPVGKWLTPPVTRSAISKIMSPAYYTATPVSAPATAHAHATPSARPAIGGPNQPEMGSFKPVSMKDMVNLFTGDFSYNIPLLDVGGYPVNIYYNGGIGLEQEASWVGLGWNINPGTISRNMRGIPDDFNGQELLQQSQNVKPNITWGINSSADVELVGIKFLPDKLSLTEGISFNNYLGPALMLGVKGGVQFNIANCVLSEKSDLSLGVSGEVAANLNSRSGLTLSPSVSLTAGLHTTDNAFTVGSTLATSFNSRVGVKSLQLSEQVSANMKAAEIEPELAYALHYLDGFVNQHATTINFARPSYIPTMRMPMVNSALSGQFQLGGGIFGGYTSLEVVAFQQKSSIDPSKIVQRKPMVGYLYYEQATSNPDAVTDFTRFNDREVTPNTPIISAPQYTYDVFTIQGEGTGGSIRAYRSDLGTVRDNITTSQDNNAGVGADIGPPGHYGVNVNLVSTPSTIGDWTIGNKLRTGIPFRGPTANGNMENVSFRNPGEVSVLDNSAYTRIGGTDLVRFELSGDPHNPNVEPVLDRFSQAKTFLGTVNAATTSPATTRQKRSQVIDFLIGDDARRAGLDKQIRNYDNQTILDNTTDTLLYTNISRSEGFRLGHHISQIDVTEGNGKRYVYGLPVYNTLQQDYTFTVANSNIATSNVSDTISYSPTEATTGNPAITSGDNGRDGYVEVTQTPPYAHSFLLTGLLSPDYVDVTGDGITDDDLGQAVKFNYTQVQDPRTGQAAVHRWRTPAGENIANFNPGNRSQVKDDKGLISYGEREAWYLHSIESKTMIALFMLEDRSDGKGVKDSNGGIDAGDVSSKALKEIRLYSKSDLKQNGLTNAKPVKTVHFAYSYTLCPGTRDNASANGGKLTLDSVWFTFNGQNRANKDKYVFSYTDSTCKKGNPAYLYNATDRWGTYKPPAMNPGAVKNSDFPYTPQDQPGQVQSPKIALDTNAAAWSLKRILLPSGGQLEIGYESDDYAYVQNKRAMDMMTIAGFGSSPTSMSNRLYDVVGSGIKENDYLFVKVPVPCNNANDVMQRYLQGVTQIAVKLDVNMPAGTEHVTSYATIDSYGVYDATTIWIKLAEVNGTSPLSLTAIEFLRQQLPAEAFPGYDVSGGSGLEQIANALSGLLDGLKGAFTGPVSYLRSQGMAQVVVLSQSFARLNDPDGFKYGGGQRVKYIRLKDNWKTMTKQGSASQFNSVYTQTYDYTTTETFSDTIRTISSGVASYEPGIGNDENPFQTIVQVQDKLPLGPTSYGAVELPVLEPFFPAPLVGYSQVTVRSVSSAPPGPAQKSRSGIGRQVTEFFTARDYPVIYCNTSIDPSTDLEAHDASTTNFFYQYAFDSRALSQGFLVATNDMHGKLKTQSSYADNDSTLLVNQTQNFYRNTGLNELNETFNFVSSAQGGAITSGNLGVDIELMTDTRQFTVTSSSENVEGQADLFYFVVPVWLPFIWPISGNSENDYRAVTTTKVISYHSILDSTAVFDKGSTVSTKNLLYDAETGQVIVTRTNNEFKQPIYSTAYPAWWAYNGMGPAYQNIGVQYNSSTPLNFTDGRLVGSTFNSSLLVSGDELLITSPSPHAPSCPAIASSAARVWVMDRSKNNPPFPATAPNLIFIDSAGNLYNNTNVTGFRVIRSGRRNMLDENAASIVSMVSPIVVSGGTQKLSIDSLSSVVNASALEFNEKWQVDKDVFPNFTLVTNPGTCPALVLDCNGVLSEKGINPYCKGLLGNFRPFRELVFYGSRMETDPTQPTNLPKNGFLDSFALYWNFNTSNSLAPNTTNTLWVEKNRMTRYNDKGLQLETKDPLNIYTTAQYGYGKNLPVAVVHNSSVDQAFAEGFEDYAFSSTIDGAGSGCPKRTIDFSSFGTILNTNSLSFQAHTGSYALKVAPNVQATGALRVNTARPNIYHFNLNPDTTLVLNNPGGNITDIEIIPPYGTDGTQPQSILASQEVSFGSGASLSANIGLIDTAVFNGFGTNFQHNLSMTTTQFMQITLSGNYTVSMSVEDPGPIGNTGSIGMNLIITGNDVNIFSPLLVSGIDEGHDTAFTVFLCAGNYEVTTSLVNEYDFTEAFDNIFPNVHSELFQYSINSSSGTFKNLSTQSGCIFTDPITPTDTMQNPLFNLIPNTKMEVSAWVREDCPGTPCTLTNYTHEHVGIKFPGSTVLPSVTMVPSGNIIDGWQRIDASFTVPSDATSANLVLGNDGSQNVYFDDIRICPFNADMKGYVYDPVSLRLLAELDANNYATFYEYDEEGTPIRTKAETQRGIQTIKETRSAKQKNINTFK